MNIQLMVACKCIGHLFEGIWKILEEKSIKLENKTTFGSHVIKLVTRTLM